MCTDHETPMIELHDLDGSVIGIRRDLIALVIGNSHNPLGGAVVGTEYGRVEVVESPADVLAAVRGHDDEPNVTFVNLDDSAPAGSA